MTHEYNYLSPSLQLSYITDFRVFCSLVQMAESPVATMQVLNRARNAVASRRDMLVGRQRRKYNVKRKQEIDQLAEAYDSIYGRMLKMGFR